MGRVEDFAGGKNLRLPAAQGLRALKCTAPATAATKARVKKETHSNDYNSGDNAHNHLDNSRHRANPYAILHGLTLY